MDGAKVPGLADAHVDGNEAGSLAKVARDQCLAWNRSQIKITKLRADNVWCGVVAIDSRRRKSRTLSEQPVPIRVLSGRDIEGRTRAGHDERIQTHLPPGQIDCPCKSE